MRCLSIASLIFIFVHTQNYCQIDSGSGYKNLKTIKVYSADLSTETHNGGFIYKVDGWEDSLFNFDKLVNTWYELDSCCPCIVQSYDTNEILLQESVSCHGYEIGWFKEYYPNGNVKLSGQFQENHSGNWDNIIATGKCCVPEGEWTYFNKSGDTLYSEYWHNGYFIKQVPEQPRTEIWSVGLTLNDKPFYDYDWITFDQVKDFKIIPAFKNSNRDSVNLSINFEITTVRHQHFVQTFSPEELDNIDIQKMLSDAQIPDDEFMPDEFAMDLVWGDIKTTYKLEIYNNGNFIVSYDLFLIP